VAGCLPFALAVEEGVPAGAVAVGFAWAGAGRAVVGLGFAGVAAGLALAVAGLEEEEELVAFAGASALPAGLVVLVFAWAGAVRVALVAEGCADAGLVLGVAGWVEGFAELVGFIEAAVDFGPAVAGLVAATARARDLGAAWAASPPLRLPLALMPAAISSSDSTSRSSSPIILPLLSVRGMRAIEARSSFPRMLMTATP